MNRHQVTRIVIVALAALVFSTAITRTAAAEVPKIRKMEGAYKFDDRVMAVESKGPQTKRCIAVGVGNFAILTSYECLADWWDKKQDYSVRYASDEKREHYFGGFQRAYRGSSTASGWALLETHGHSAGYFGYGNLDRVSELDVQAFDFIGLSNKVKGGRQPAIQSGCRLERTVPGVYTSECGRDFQGAILILHTNVKQPYVAGLAVVQSQLNIGKRRVMTLGVTSSAEYGAKLGELRRNQQDRYATVMTQRNAAMAAQRAEMSILEDEARERRERRQAQFEKFAAALGQLSATLARGKAQTPVPYVGGLPTTATPSTGASGSNCPLTLRGPAVYIQQTAVAPSSGGTFQIEVDTPAGCWWRFEVKHLSGGAWISINSPLSGTGPGRLSFSAIAHPEDDSIVRTLMFTVARPPRPGMREDDLYRELRVTQCTPSTPPRWCGASASTSQ